MAKEKDKKKAFYKPIKNPELLNGNKDTQPERLERGNRGNPSDKDWKGFIEKQKNRDASEKANLDSKIAEKKKGENDKQTITKTLEHDKDR